LSECRLWVWLLTTGQDPKAARSIPFAIAMSVLGALWS
jgi:hypothetical protein